jgi:AAA ATPase containing von Willebrand factor type A (vWA) domain
MQYPGWKGTGKTKGQRMNTKNNLENNKLPVNEEKTDNNLHPESGETESKVETAQSVTFPEEEPADESSVEEPPVEKSPVEESPVEEPADPLEEPVEESPVEESPVEESPVEEPADPLKETSVEGPVENEEVGPILEEPAEKNEVEPKSEEIAAEELPTEELPTEEHPEERETVEGETVLEEATVDEEIPEEATAEEHISKETPAKEVVPEETEADGDTSIDYDLEDGNEKEETEDEEDDMDEGAVSDDIGATLLSVEEIVQRLRELLNSQNPRRKEVDEYKNQFYRSLRNETEAQKQEFLSAGGEEIDFIAKEPEVYAEGKELLQKIKEKRAAILVKEEAEKEQNVAKKLAIIEQIKLLTEAQGQGDFNKTYQEFKSLQQEWNEIKLVPQSKVNELWKSYQRYVEKFYDLVRINNEFREYDFKKNLELKTELCEAAERLDDEPDVVSAFHQLQNLHQEWREIGPVSRKDREEIWNRFKEASTLINKKYQAHFEGLKEKEDENLELKTALCEKLETIDYSQINTIKDWNNKVKEVLEIQTQWRQIGYVPRKWNTKIYKRYRAACDLFFKTKNDFYKSLRGEMDENLKKKIALCERAEAMKDSQDWKKTTQDMIDIQKEWKSIGIVPHKYVDSVWKRFITACDSFFEQKKMHTSSQYEEEAQNLEAKRAIVDKINKLETSLHVEEALPLLREWMDEWYAIGHVPYKMKDRSYREFYDATEAQFDRLNIDKADRKLESFKTNISDMAKSGNAKSQLLREREKLMRQYERMKNEVQTYENNIGFLSVSSKKGNHLVDDMNQKVEKIKSELQLIIKKIDAIDRELI